MKVTWSNDSSANGSPAAWAPHEGTTVRGTRRQHVGALIEANHPAAIASDERSGDHAGAGRDVEHTVLVFGADGSRESLSPTRILAQ